jgi:hypothetical protein
VPAIRKPIRVASYPLQKLEGLLEERMQPQVTSGLI